MLALIENSNITCPNRRCHEKYWNRWNLLNVRHRVLWKSMYSKHHIIKVLENCFQNINSFSWIKLILGSSYNSSWLKPLYYLIFIMFFIVFLISSYLIKPHATTSIGYTKPYAKQNQSNLLSKLYTDHNTLWIKHASHQKAESLRAALFQS